MKTFSKSDVVEVAKHYGIALDANWTGPGPLWPIVTHMMEMGCVVVIKLDGARQPELDDNGQFTIIAQGGSLGDAMIRGDFDDLDEGLSYLVGNYNDIAGRG